MPGILIVDDDPTIRTMFARALGALGEVETAANGAEALRLLGAKRYGIVLLDLHMPVIDGFVILHTLSSKPGPNRDTPIYVITADISEQARIRALRRHAVFLLTKPVPLATLTSLVDSALKKAASRGTPPEGNELQVSKDPVPQVGPKDPGPLQPLDKPAPAGRMTPPIRPGAYPPPTPTTPKKPGG